VQYHLRLFELLIPSLASLELDDGDRLLAVRARLPEMKYAASVRYFGTGSRLKPLTGVDDLVTEFSRHRPDSYSFTDVRDITKREPQIEWRLEIRPKLFAAHLSLICEPADFPTLRTDLVQLNRVLSTCVKNRIVHLPFSFLEVIGVPFAVQPPTKLFGRLSPRSLVDVASLAEPSEEDAATLQALREGDLPDGVRREDRDDLLIVSWGDPTSRPVEEILGERYEWYAAHCELETDPSYDAHGDKEFALFDAKPVDELTAYSSATCAGMKALVFDSPEDVRGDVERLRDLLDVRQVSTGEKLSSITVVAPSRGAAMSLEPLAREHRLGVAYVGADDRLWNPFPTEQETVE
jgi:hypothetical protein